MTCINFKPDLFTDSYMCIIHGSGALFNTIESMYSEFADVTIYDDDTYTIVCNHLNVPITNTKVNDLLYTGILI